MNVLRTFHQARGERGAIATLLLLVLGLHQRPREVGPAGEHGQELAGRQG
ncbi:MAG TPA: hypothetical protein VHC97_04430 [Thermoanaerobaculia bacterium]|jgi:uncharacterized protein (DUF2342 family)|nr:hypothetical protein [Thermoanaerobaculia bacterium]